MIDVPPSASRTSRAHHKRPQTHRRRDIRRHPPQLSDRFAAVRRPRQRPQPRTPWHALSLEPLGTHSAVVATFPGSSARRWRLGPDPELARGGDPVLSSRRRASLTGRRARGQGSARGRRPRRCRPRRGRATVRAKRRAAAPDLQGPPATPLAIRDSAIVPLNSILVRRPTMAQQPSPEVSRGGPCYGLRIARTRIIGVRRHRSRSIMALSSSNLQFRGQTMRARGYGQVDW